MFLLEMSPSGCLVPTLDLESDNSRSRPITLEMMPKSDSSVSGMK